MRNQRLYQEAKNWPSVELVFGEFITEIDELEAKIDKLETNNELYDRDIKKLEEEVFDLVEENKKLREQLDDATTTEVE